jgi:hypothetical protein
MVARAWALAAIVATGLMLSSKVCLAEPKIGNAVTVNNQVEGVSAGGSRALATGSEVFSNELVRTSSESKAELLFLDNTNLSVGPMSTIRLDRFVYDPNKSSGNVVVTASRGALRFITGSQDPKNYTIKTAYATLGVRGTEFYLLSNNNEVQIQLIKGEVIVRTISGKVVSLTTPNSVLTVDSNGNTSAIQIVDHPIADFSDLGPPATKYAELFPTKPNPVEPHLTVPHLAAPQLAAPQLAAPNLAAPDLAVTYLTVPNLAVLGGVAAIGAVIGVIVSEEHEKPASP